MVCLFCTYCWASGGMVDTLALGASGIKPVEVQVLSRPPVSTGHAPIIIGVG